MSSCKMYAHHLLNLVCFQVFLHCQLYTEHHISFSSDQWHNQETLAPWLWWDFSCPWPGSSRSATGEWKVAWLLSKNVPKHFLFRGAKADIDSPFFKLHYRTTATILFISCLLVTANNLIGKTIDCIGENIPGNVLNTYCWIMSTFSVPSKC